MTTIPGKALTPYEFAKLVTHIQEVIQNSTEEVRGSQVLPLLKPDEVEWFVPLHQLAKLDCAVVQLWAFNQLIIGEAADGKGKAAKA